MILEAMQCPCTICDFLVKLSLFFFSGRLIVYKEQGRSFINVFPRTIKISERDEFSFFSERH